MNKVKLMMRRLRITHGLHEKYAIDPDNMLEATLTIARRDVNNFVIVFKSPRMHWMQEERTIKDVRYCLQTWVEYPPVDGIFDY